MTPTLIGLGYALALSIAYYYARRYTIKAKAEAKRMWMRELENDIYERQN
jgi:hypothetical protein